MARHCIICSKRAYSDYCVQHKPRKPINQVSDKQVIYHKWLEAEVRPFLIKRDGNQCSCCHRLAYKNEKLDIEHTLGVGSHANLKRDVNNMTLMCRFPCHRNKTDGIKCVHD